MSEIIEFTTTDNKIISIDLLLSNGNTITLNENASKGFTDSLDKQGNFLCKAIVYNNDDNLTQEIIYTDHITFIKFKY